MINVYLNNAIQPVTSENLGLLSQTKWVDLLNPSKEEEEQVEAQLHVNIPTRNEMKEIEFTSRLYRDNDHLVMTILMIAHSDSPNPILDPVTMIFTKSCLITIRYIEPQAFNLFAANLKKDSALPQQPLYYLIALLEAVIDRLADILELAGQSLDKASQKIFRSNTFKTNKPINYKQLLLMIGSYGDLNSKARESLITINRLITFFENQTLSNLNSKQQTQLLSINKDIESLSKHADFLSGKVNFLLDATLGMINIEQNNILRILSVAAVVFLPPTLIASMYGMNFKFIPELEWFLGYPFAITMIILAALLPYLYFKHKKWL